MRYYWEDARWPWRADESLRRFVRRAGKAGAPRLRSGQAPRLFQTKKSSPQRRRDRRESAERSKQPLRALDLGMGYGRNAIWLARQGYEVEGWETDARYVREARREARRLGLALKARRGDFARGRWRGPYEVVVISFALHQLRRSTALRVLRRARKALAPNGTIFLLAKLVDDRYSESLQRREDWVPVAGERNTFRHQKRGWVLSAVEPGEIRAALRGLKVRHYRETVLTSRWGNEPVGHRVAEVVAQRKS
ncbi:MAG: class I SAM-dependent methyltransferase [Terriglobia bacterium]